MDNQTKVFIHIILSKDSFAKEQKIDLLTSVQNDI